MLVEEKKHLEKGDTGFGKLGDFIKGGKGRKIIVAAGIAGIALILLSEFLPKQVAASSTEISTEEYIQQTENKLSALVGNIEGAGACQVMVTLENGVEYVYASQNKVSTDRVEDKGGDKLSQRDGTEENIIIVDTDQGRQGLLITEIQPTVKGVVIVCEGGDQPLVQERIIDAVTTALNISSKRVCVTKKT